MTREYAPTSTSRRIVRGLGRRCPRCGARAFRSYFQIEEHCPRCGFGFEREAGYWAGALIVNTIVTFATFLVVFIGGMLITWPEVPWGQLMAITVATNLVVPIVFYPMSKTIWLALEMSWHPLEPGELP